jgi:hypothetical protein
MIIQQARAVQSLAGVVQAGLADRGCAAGLAPRVEILPADDRAAAVGRQADAAEVVAVQVGHGVTRAVAHRYDLAAHAVVALGRAADDLLPQPLEVNRRHATHRLGNALPIGVAGVSFGHTAAGHVGGLNVRRHRSASTIDYGFSSLSDVEWSYVIGRSTSSVESARLPNHIHSQTSKSTQKPGFVHN